MPQKTKKLPKYVRKMYMYFMVIYLLRPGDLVTRTGKRDSACVQETPT